MLRLRIIIRSSKANGEAYTIAKMIWEVANGIPIIDAGANIVYKYIGES